MAKLIVVYRIPRDPAEFDRYYAQVHTSRKKMPGLRRLEVTRVTWSTKRSKRSLPDRRALFDNAAAREAALASNEAKATRPTYQNSRRECSVYFGVGLNLGGDRTRALHSMT